MTTASPRPAAASTLALSYGDIQPDMGAPGPQGSRDAAYDRITAVLGTLRKPGRLDWAMVLDLTRELDEWQTYRSPREARAALRERYDEDRWLGSPASRSSSSRRTRWSRCASRWRNAGRCRLPPRAALLAQAPARRRRDADHRYARTGNGPSSTSSAISIRPGSTCSGPGRRRWRTSACGFPSSSGLG